ncbi:MAG: energy transducer TonB [Crocinitomicaceae bacterium]|jgi:protein TonB|nr:energy transducer TonB [Crocinitomicaceae bacterium]
MKQVYILLFLIGLSAFAFGQEPISKLDTTKSQISAVFDVEAEFPGGTDSLRRYIIDNIRMDSIVEFSDKEMYNKVLVRFLVNKKGIIDHVVIIKAQDYCPPCNKEALRLVRSMPKWTPATLNGRPVSMYFTLPIIFSVQ